MQPGSNRLCPRSARCGESLRAHITLAVTGGLTLLGDCKVDKDLGVGAQPPLVKPGLEHAVLNEDKI
jgi:hypothetical protein